MCTQIRNVSSLRGQDTLEEKACKTETSVSLKYCPLISIRDRSYKVYIFLKLRGSFFQFPQEKKNIAEFPSFKKMHSLWGLTVIDFIESIAKEQWSCFRTNP